MSQQHPPSNLFNRAVLYKRRQRARGQFSEADFLHREIIADIIDRLEVVTRDFEQAVFCGPASQLLEQAVTPKCGIKAVTVYDPLLTDIKEDIEEVFQWPKASLDLFVSLMSLHHINDLPGTLVKIKASLKPDGLFLAAFPGEENLKHFRQILYQAEMETTAGVTPRLSPMVSIQDIGRLLQRAGFTLPVVDKMRRPVRYHQPQRLIQDLRAMAETSLLVDSYQYPMKRQTLKRLYELLPNPETQKTTACYEILFITGWSPHPDQQSPLPPGSGKISLADAIQKHTKKNIT
ncbi:MAG: methyltransferase domain-containing protein [bacterium]